VNISAVDAGLPSAVCDTYLSVGVLERFGIVRVLWRSMKIGFTMIILSEIQVVSVASKMTICVPLNVMTTVCTSAPYYLSFSLALQPPRHGQRCRPIRDQEGRQ